MLQFRAAQPGPSLFSFKKGKYMTDCLYLGFNKLQVKFYILLTKIP
jgi:hypothetical protein